METLQLFGYIAIGLLCLFLGYKVSNKPGLLDALAGLDRQRMLLLLTLLGTVVAVSSTLGLIYLVIFVPNVSQVVIALVGSFTGCIDTAMIVQPFGYWFGSSNGSQLKDEAAANASAGSALVAPDKPAVA